MPVTEASATLEELRALHRPVLARALLCLAFGLLTVFWQPSNYWSWGDPGLSAVTWAVGLFMIAHGAVLLWLHRSLAAPLVEGPERSAIQSFAVLYALGGAVALLFAGQLGQLVLIVGLVYGIAGLTELILGLRTSQTSAMGRDWTIAGLVAVLAAAGLFLFGEMGSKALFGIVGGAAMIVGVFHLIAALTFRHDARVLQRHGTRGDSANRAGGPGGP